MSLWDDYRTEYQFDLDTNWSDWLGPEEMDDSHLMNMIRWCEKNGEPADEYREELHRRLFG